MKKNAKGFTLIELVITMTILSVMAGSLYPFLMTAIDSWIFLKDETDLLYESRQALNTMEREVRQAKNILVVSKSTFSFSNVKNEVVTISRNGKQLFVSKGAIKNALLSEHLAAGDKGLVFSYLDADGKPAPQAGDVRSVRIQMSFKLGESNPTLESMVKIRNL